MYDKNNVFAKILRDEIPSKRIYEDDNYLCFKSTDPKDDIHVLLITKKPYINLADFISKTDAKEFKAFFDKALEISNMLNLVQPVKYFFHGEEVPHLHLHIMGKAEK